MNLEELFSQFVKEKTYLAGVTSKTVRFYRQSFNAYTRSVGSVMPDRFVLNDFVVKLRENGMSPLNWKPKTWTEFRMHALIYTLIDTGARIDVELLNLKRQDILIDDLLIKLSGKGSKQRMAQCPLSFAKS